MLKVDMPTRVALALLLTSFATAVVDGQKVGPANGALVIVGGAMQDPAIVKRFIALAGGADASIVVIPTAGDADSYNQSWSGLRIFRENGARNLTVLHTRDRKVADTDAFVGPLTNAQGVFFSGGRQWRLADAYLHTRTHKALDALLARGGVIGGTSAGATILGSFLVRGDTKGNELMIGDHVEGMAFLKNSAIDQHVLRRNRQFDLIDVMQKHPDLLGIGIDEDTAIVVEGDRFEVIGQRYVLIHDRNSVVSPAGTFFFMAPGDKFDLVTREATRPQSTDRPLEHVKKKPS
jgi:cyanophycinase